MEKVGQYCKWADVKKVDEFFEQAASYVLSKDKDWVKHVADNALKPLTEESSNV